MAFSQQEMPVRQTTIPVWQHHHQEAVSWCQAGVILNWSFGSMSLSVLHSSNLQSTNKRAHGFIPYSRLSGMPFANILTFKKISFGYWLSVFLYKQKVLGNYLYLVFE